jgi:hypothetical protein
MCLLVSAQKLTTPSELKHVAGKCDYEELDWGFEVL